MTFQIRPVPDTAGDNQPDAVGTPEGDNEIPTDQPLEPAADIATEDLENPRGANPKDPYKRDHN